MLLLILLLVLVVLYSCCYGNNLIVFNINIIILFIKFAYFSSWHKWQVTHIIIIISNININNNDTVMLKKTRHYK